MERIQELLIVQQLILEGYNKKEIVQLIMQGDLLEKKYCEAAALKIVKDAKDSCIINKEESETIPARFLYVYKKCMKKEDYGNAIKALKELKEFGNTDNTNEVTIKFVKE